MISKKSDNVYLVNLLPADTKDVQGPTLGKHRNLFIPKYKQGKVLSYYVTSITILPASPWRNAGLVVDPLHPYVCPTTTILGCLACVICNSKSFHSFIFKLCIMIVHTLKMCTFYFVHIS